MHSDRLNSIWEKTRELCLIPGLSGREGRVAATIEKHLTKLGLNCTKDLLGNLWTTVQGKNRSPSILLFAHMDQLGFVVRKIESDGRLSIERVGGVPEKALQSQRVVITVNDDTDIPGIIGTKSHHSTSPEEKYRVVPCSELSIDAGFENLADAEKAGIKIGSPVVYRPWADRFGDFRIGGAAIDDRAGCAILLEVAEILVRSPITPTVHILFSVQEEFNLRGVLPAARQLKPLAAVQVDLAIASDTPETAHLGDVQLGRGPCLGMHSFHGRGTLNGLIPHQGLVRLFESEARKSNIEVQRNVHMGALTETSYLQFEGEGIACLDIGFPMRYSHAPAELCDLRDLSATADLISAAARSENAIELILGR